MRPIRHRRLRAATAALALLAAGSGLETASGKARGTDEALAAWIDGPVRYIALAEEVAQFRALDSDLERAVFVERFWTRRDPDPDTLVNEYRTLFWERVRDANDRILDSPRPGWMTDRGKIYILYGPPNEIQDLPNLEPDSGPTSSRGLIRWIYERPAGRMDLDAIVVVPFVRDVTGEYRVSNDPKLASPFLDEYGIRTKTTQRFDRLLTEIGGRSRESELSVMLDLGRMQEVPPAEKVLLERVDTIENYRARPLAVEVDRFLHPERPGTLVSLTVSVPGAKAANRPAILARLRPRDGGDERILDEAAFKFRDRPDGSGVVAQARIVLPPGDWSAMVVAAEPGTAETSVWRGAVPGLDRGTGLSLSDVMLATAIETVEVAALSSWDEPFHLGPFRVVPLAGSALPPGGALDLAYEVYGGVPPYTVSYRLEGLEDDGRWVALGRPAVLAGAGAVQGWQLPTASTWPLGRYRVEIEVADSAGARAAATVPFELARPQPPSTGAPQGADPDDDGPAVVPALAGGDPR